MDPELLAMLQRTGISRIGRDPRFLKALTPPQRSTSVQPLPMSRTNRFRNLMGRISGISDDPATLQEQGVSSGQASELRKQGLLDFGLSLLSRSQSQGFGASLAGAVSDSRQSVVPQLNQFRALKAQEDERKQEEAQFLDQMTSAGLSPEQSQLLLAAKNAGPTMLQAVSQQMFSSPQDREGFATMTAAQAVERGIIPEGAYDPRDTLQVSSTGEIELKKAHKPTGPIKPGDQLGTQQAKIMSEQFTDLREAISSAVDTGKAARSIMGSVTEGNLFTGALAREKLTAAKLVDAVPWAKNFLTEDMRERIANTEEMDANMGRLVMSALATGAFGSGQAISDRDREFAAQMQGASPELTGRAIMRLNGIMLDNSVSQLLERRQELDGFSNFGADDSIRIERQRIDRILKDLAPEALRDPGAYMSEAAREVRARIREEKYLQGDSTSFVQPQSRINLFNR